MSKVETLLDSFWNANQSGKLRIAKALLEEGLTVEQVCDLTGLRAQKIVMTVRALKRNEQAVRVDIQKRRDWIMHLRGIEKQKKEHDRKRQEKAAKLARKKADASAEIQAIKQAFVARILRKNQVDKGGGI